MTTQDTNETGALREEITRHQIVAVENAKAGMFHSAMFELSECIRIADVIMAREEKQMREEIARHQTVAVENTKAGMFHSAMFELSECIRIVGDMTTTKFI